MAKVELAYSLEINAIVDAMEANELWLESILSDKRAFECIYENCDAKITCKNMDTYADNRKVIPHFIMASRENKHNALCEIYKEYEERESIRGKSKNEEEASNIGRSVCFHMERPENHRVITRTFSGEVSQNEQDSKRERKRTSEKRKNRNSNYYWLNSLIGYYINSFKEGRIHQDTVEIDFGKNNKFTYRLSKLFKRINKEIEVTDKDKNHYVYFGKGKVFFRKDGGYDLVFYEKFIDSEKNVKCVISKKMIEDCQYGRVNKVSILEAAKGKERFIYVLSSKNVNNTHGKVYLNVNSLDCIAISEIDLDAIDEIAEK